MTETILFILLIVLVSTAVVLTVTLVVLTVTLVVDSINFIPLFFKVLFKNERK